MNIVKRSTNVIYKAIRLSIGEMWVCGMSLKGEKFPKNNVLCHDSEGNSLPTVTSTIIQ